MLSILNSIRDQNSPTFTLWNFNAHNTQHSSTLTSLPNYIACQEIDSFMSENDNLQIVTSPILFFSFFWKKNNVLAEIILICWFTPPFSVLKWYNHACNAETCSTITKFSENILIHQCVFNIFLLSVLTRIIWTLRLSHHISQPFLNPQSLLIFSSFNPFEEAGRHL